MRDDRLVLVILGSPSSRVPPPGRNRGESGGRRALEHHHPIPKHPPHSLPTWMLREGAHRRFGLLLRVGISGSSSQPRCLSPSLPSNTSGGFSVLEDASHCAFPSPPANSSLQPHRITVHRTIRRLPADEPSLSVALLSLRSTPRILLSCCKAACTDSLDAKRQGTLLHITGRSTSARGGPLINDSGS